MHTNLQACIALITSDVHNRDTTSGLLAARCAAATDFAWLVALRYEYCPDTDAIAVRQAFARLASLTR